MTPEIINDLLKIPSLEERARILGENSQVRDMVISVLATDPEYKALPDASAAEVRRNLGLPEPSAPVQLPSPPIIEESQIPSATPMEAASQASIETSANVQRRSLESMSQPKPNLASPFSPASQDLMSALFDQYVRQPFTERFITQRPENIGSSLARGAARSIPGLSAAVIPRELGEPNFVSVENAARIATDALITLPIFLSSPVLGAAKSMQMALGAKAFFMKHPVLARAISEAVNFGGVDAAYRAFVKGTTNLIREGSLKVPDLFREYPQDFGASAVFILGFSGAFHSVAAQILSKSDVNKALGQAFREFGVESRTTFKPTPKVPEPPLVFSPPITGEEVSLVNLSPQFPRSMGVFAPDVPLSRQPTLMEPASIFSKDPQLDLFTLPYPRSVRQPFSATPTEKAITDDILASNNTSLKPDGSMETSLTEGVLESVTKNVDRAIAGDVVYINSSVKGVGPTLGRVLHVLDDGAVVQGPKARFFIKYDKVRKSEFPFAPGEVVARTSSGETFVVDGYFPDKRVRLRDNSGKFAIEDSSRLSSKITAMTNKESAERAALDIATPAPQGERVVDTFVAPQTMFDVIKGEAGAFIPGKFFPGFRKRKQQDLQDIASGKLMPIIAATHPGGPYFGLYKYYNDSVTALLQPNVPEWAMAAKLIEASTRTEEQIAHKFTDMLVNMRKLIGIDEEVSKKLFRFGAGVPKPGETLTTAEKVALDEFNQFGREYIIPSINSRRAIIGKNPVPPDYNYMINLFPEMVLTSGFKGNGWADTLAPAITVKGVDNEISLDVVKLINKGGSLLLSDLSKAGNLANEVIRLNVDTNFWKIADRMIKFVGQEVAWRDTIEYVKGISDAAKTASAKKFLTNLAEVLEGASISPAMSDLTESAILTDMRLARHFAGASSANIEIAGKTFRITAPYTSLSDMSLENSVMRLKRLSYAEAIGGSLRMIIQNLTQVPTHMLAQMPGGVKDLTANIFHLLGGYMEAITPLFSKNAIKKYQDAGVIHDVEELMRPSDITQVKGSFSAGLAYYNSYFWNTFWGINFLNMRSSEIINRVAGKEGLLSSYERKATEFGYNPFDPAFHAALEEMSTIATNMSQFLYTKGFKSPIQRDLGMGLLLDVKKGSAPYRFLFAPLGELATQFNTFTMKTWGMASLAWNSFYKKHPGYLTQMMSMEGPDEFREFLTRLDKESRVHLLRALAFSTLTASSIAATTTLATLAYQVSPLGQIGFNPLTKVLKTMIDLTRNLTTLNISGAVDTAKRGFKPMGRALQRLERGGDVTDMMFKTRDELEEKRGVGVPPGPLEQMQRILNPDERLGRP